MYVFMYKMYLFCSRIYGITIITCVKDEFEDTKEVIRIRKSKLHMDTLNYSGYVFGDDTNSRQGRDRMVV
jgi:hypothetical protein